MDSYCLIGVHCSKHLVKVTQIYRLMWHSKVHYLTKFGPDSCRIRTTFLLTDTQTDERINILDKMEFCQVTILTLIVIGQTNDGYHRTQRDEIFLNMK